MVSVEPLSEWLIIQVHSPAHAELHHREHRADQCDALAHAEGIESRERRRQVQWSWNVLRAPQIEDFAAGIGEVNRALPRDPIGHAETLIEVDEVRAATEQDV